LEDRPESRGIATESPGSAFADPGKHHVLIPCSTPFKLCPIPRDSVAISRDSGDSW